MFTLSNIRALGHRWQPATATVLACGSVEQSLEMGFIYDPNRPASLGGDETQ